jgi:tetratricopeptide (TPR) repeat protein
MFTRYSSHGSVLDLQDIISLHRRVIHSMSLQGNRHYASLNHLAEALCERWYHLTQMRDIEESITLFEEALGLCTNDDECRAIILGNLAQALVYLNMQNTEVSRYTSAISLLREALSLMPLHNDVLAVLKARLCYAIARYYTFSGCTSSDLQEVIDLCRNTTGLLPIGHRDRPEVLRLLACPFRVMDDQDYITEAQSHAEETRLLSRWAIDTQSFTHPRRAECLTSLGNRLIFAYNRRRGSKADLDEGIRLIRDATALVTPSHIAYPSVLSTLAFGLSVRFYHIDRHQEDIDDSIKLHDQLLNATPSSSKSRYRNMHNLAEVLAIRHQYFHDPVVLHRAVALGREALGLCPPGHPDHEYSVRMLSWYLITDPHSLVTDLDEMFGLLEAVLGNEYAPDANLPGHAQPLDMMARLLYTRYLRLSDPKDWIRSVELFEAAVQDQSSSFGFRFKIAKRWISAAESLDSPEIAMKAYRMAIHISPYRIYPGLDLSSQLDQLKRDYATISCDAACCALVTADVSEALTLLEQGRATFWAQRLQLRMSFDAIPSDLGERLRSATQKLQEFHSLKKARNASGEQQLLDQRLHHEAFQQLVREARQYPGFTDYLHPVEIEQLVGAIETGILIVLLSSKTYGSFAIIIRARSPRVEKLPLSSITAEDLQSMVEELQVSVCFARQEMRNAANGENERLKLAKGKSGPKRVPDTMARLWSQVGEPIMRHLGIEVSIP